MWGFYIFVNMYACIDESGDLGWKFNAKFRDGGSSRYLTIAILLMPSTAKLKANGVVNKVKRLCEIPLKSELKGSSCTDKQAVWIAKQVRRFVEETEGAKLFTITVKKRRVSEELRILPNVLYNYMINMSLLPNLATLPEVSIVHDKRTIKVGASMQLDQYLRHQLKEQYKVDINLSYFPLESKHNKSLQLIDWCTNFVWRYYEDGRSEAYNELKPILAGNEIRLFF